MKKVWVILLLACIAFITIASAAAEESYVFYVYKDDMSGENNYLDIAYMGGENNGNDGSMSIDKRCPDDPVSGKSCMKLTYSPKDSSHWAGMLWLSGDKNFPPNPPVKGVDTSQAKRLTFWAKGNGAANFFIEDGKGNKSLEYVELTDDWEQYTLIVPEGWDMICVGFGWASNYDDADEATMTFYLDEIRFEG